MVPSGSSLSATSTASGGEVSIQASLYSPGGCVGQTDYAHSSNGYVKTTYGPYASVHGRTVCVQPVALVTAKAEVWKKVWHGNTRLLVGPLVDRQWSRQSPDSAPHYYCGGQGTNWYVGITNHTSVEGGTTYTARTVQYGTRAVSEFECRR